MAVMAVAALTASAQKGEFHITPHVSLGYAHISDMSDFESNISGAIGAEAEYMISNQFGLSLGADYKYIRSLNKTKTHNGTETKAYFDYSYLNLPVLAQIHFGEGFAFKAGVQPMFLLTADEHLDKESSHSTSYHNDSFKDELESFLLAVPVGISYTFGVPVTVDVRCNIPTGKINKHGDSCKMTDIAISVGYRF